MVKSTVYCGSVLRLRWLIGCLAMANPASLAAVQHLEKNPTVIEKVRRLEETTATGLKPYLVKWLDQPGASEYAYDVVMPLVESMTNDANLAGFVASLVQSISGQFYNGLSAMLSDEAASFFNKSDAVQGVYPDVMMRMHVTEDTADDNRYHRLRFPASEDSRLARHLQAGTTSAPEKKQSGAPYQLGRIDERNDARTGEYFYTDVGTGVDIYVLDSGINFNHEEFTGRICTECAANFARDQPATDASDCNGHGTHVAALAAGTKFGPAKDATIIPIRVYDCSNAGPLSQVIQGINHVLATKQSRKRPSVVNMSFGGERSSLLDEAVNALTANNIFVVVAAGNDKNDACSESPAGSPSSFTVAASNKDDEFADFSNYGSCVDIVAPGDKIKSAWIGNSDSTKTLSGTSMSSPLTAGVAATYLSVNPGASPGQVAEALSCSATNDALTQIPSRDTPNRLLYSPPQGWAAVGQCATGSTGTSSAFSHFLGDHVATISSGTLLSSLLLTALW